MAVVGVEKKVDGVEVEHVRLICVFLHVEEEENDVI